MIMYVGITFLPAGGGGKGGLADSHEPRFFSFALDKDESKIQHHIGGFVNLPSSPVPDMIKKIEKGIHSHTIIF